MKCENVHGSIRPLHVLSKLLGFNLFSLRPGSSKVFFAKSDAVFGVVNLTYTITMNLLSWDTFFYRKVHRSEIVQTFFPVLAYLNFAIFTCAKVWNFSQRQKCGEIIQIMQGIDEELEKFGFPQNYTKQRRFIVNLILLISMPQFVLAALAYYTQFDYAIGVSVNVFIYFSYGFIANCILVSQFIASVYGIKSRFRAMNKIVRSPKLDSKAIKKLSKLRLKLLNASTLVNKTLSPLIMFSCGISFVMICVFLFSLFIFTAEFWAKYTWFAITNLLLNLHRSLIMLGLLWSCEATALEERKIVKCLYHNMIESDDADIKENLRQLIQQFTELRVKFSCGLFDFDSKLCFQMISAATMYFVILVQFERAINGGDHDKLEVLVSNETQSQNQP